MTRPFLSWEEATKLLFHPGFADSLDSIALEFDRTNRKLLPDVRIYAPEKTLTYFEAKIAYEKGDRLYGPDWSGDGDFHLRHLAETRY